MLKKIVLPLYNNLTAGTNIKTLQSKIDLLSSKNIYSIPDFIKESTTDFNDINHVINEYSKLSKLNNQDYIALKLSSLNFNPIIINQVVKNLIDNNKQVLIDAENVKNQSIINDITNELITTYNKSYIQIYKTYQMYHKDHLNLLSYDVGKYSKLGVKLVRGAYHHQDKDTNRLFTNKYETDKAYSNALDIIFNSKNSKLKSFICTHNLKDIDKMINLYSKNSELYNYNIFHASLYGFIKHDTQRIIDSGIKTFKYLPYGEIEDAVPYIIRRIYENPTILYYYFK